MLDMMLDLETLGTKPGSIILTIGAVAFDAYASGIADTDTFYARIGLDSCVRVGLALDADTLKWWLGQNEEARDEAFLQNPRTSINEALLSCMEFFRRKMDRADRARIWSHGAGYDVVLFEEALRICQLGRPPWQYGNIRDTRTLYDLAGLRRNRTPPSIPHHALHDAIAQALDVQRAYQRLSAIA